jgi:hypothetical protein
MNAEYLISNSSLNVFDDGAELLVSIFWTLSIIKKNEQ